MTRIGSRSLLVVLTFDASRQAGCRSGGHRAWARWITPSSRPLPAISTTHCLTVNQTSYGSSSSERKVRWITAHSEDAAYASQPAWAAAQTWAPGAPHLALQRQRHIERSSTLSCRPPLSDTYVSAAGSPIKNAQSVIAGFVGTLLASSPGEPCRAQGVVILTERQESGEPSGENLPEPLDELPWERWV